jgi:branched-chain amino acid transport system substrate-binding protein
MKKSRLCVLLLVLVVSVSLLLGATIASAQQKVIKVGVLMNLTGPWASIDVPAWNAIQLAVKDINDSGGLLGKKVQAMCIDTKADEGETVSAAVRLCEKEKANVVIGYCDTHWVLTAAPIVRDFNIPFITPGATHPRIPERSGAWLACMTDNAQASVMAQYVVKDLGKKRAAVWIDNAVDFSVAVCTFFEDSLKHFGGQVVYEDYFETSWTDFSALVTRLKAREGDVDVVYVGAIPDNIGLIVKQIREGGIDVDILSEDGADTPLLAETAGKYADGTIITSHVTFESKDPKVVKFAADYKKMYKVAPENAFAALGYDAMMLAAEAIKKIKSDDPKMINIGMRMIREYKGVTGSISYNEGSQVPWKSVALLKSMSGKFELIKMQVPEYMPPKEIAK